MMNRCHKDNPCNGAYGKCLDVKITDACNGNCAFCIEKGGLITGDKPVEELIKSANELTDYKKVLILGGEPFLYKDLRRFIEGISITKDEIYITTNGSMFEFNSVLMLLDEISHNLRGVNISIHHYDEEKNNSIYETAQVKFKYVKKAIEIMHRHGVKVRINCNLVKGVMDNTIDALQMMLFAKGLGADSIRFAELQNSVDLFVPAKQIFGDYVHDDPFTQGCEQVLNNFGVIDAKVRLTCGFCNPLREIPQHATRNGSETKVMYNNGDVYDGWQPAPETTQEELPLEENSTKKKTFTPNKRLPSSDCHTRYSNSTGCHGRNF